MMEMVQAAMGSLPAHAAVRLVLAAVLGGAIGLERGLKHKAAGIRTNMFICFGSALYTVLSIALAGAPGESARISAQIITGIGFIGAGSILHMRSGAVSGLTTAATLFVVAGVGMAAGGGLYVTAIFATIVILTALFVLGRIGEHFNLRRLVNRFEVSGADAEQLQAEVNSILETEHRLMENVQVARALDHYRVQFSVGGTHEEQRRLLARLQASKALGGVHFVGPAELE
jgi:putative Mg2+ transporter-C (MgtC) family protein